MVQLPLRQLQMTENQAWERMLEFASTYFAQQLDENFNELASALYGDDEMVEVAETLGEDWFDFNLTVTTSRNGIEATA